MKEYETVAKFCNVCAGSSRPQTFTKEIRPNGQILYTYDNGSVMYPYEFTEL